MAYEMEDQIICNLKSGFTRIIRVLQQEMEIAGSGGWR